MPPDLQPDSIRSSPTRCSPTTLAANVDEALAGVADAPTSTSSRRQRLAHDGDHSPLAIANREIGLLPPAARKAAGQRLGDARAAGPRRDRAPARTSSSASATRGCWSRRPSTSRCPGTAGSTGARHPLTTIQERFGDVFVAMGYEIAEGPEIEAEWYNFDALNMGPDHPARSMMDTFFVNSPDSGLVLRTHTSPVQARTMLTHQPPIYVVCPGKVFRTDELDATHTPVFHQLEGLVVDEGITMAHLKGTLDHMAQAMFGPGIEHPAAPVLLPVHRAERRDGPDVLRLPRRVGRQSRPAVQDLRQLGLDRVGRLRHGQPAGAAARAASTPIATPASRSAWASSAR